MSRLIGIVVLIFAIMAIVLGGLGMFGLARKAVAVGIEAQFIPREIFKFAVNALLVLGGIKAAQYANRKSKQSGVGETPATPRSGLRGGFAGHPAEELEVTWMRAAAVWWSVAWRSAVVGGLAGLVAGIVAGAALGAIGRSDLVGTVSGMLGILVAVPAGIWAVKDVLGREHRSYRVALVPSIEAQLERVARRGRV